MPSSVQSPQIIYSEFSNLIGLEYEDYNCWDLARLFYIQVFAIDLKHYYQNKKKAEEDRKLTESLIYTNKGDFVRVEEPEFGDLITMKIRGLESHIGIYIGNGLMLHTDRIRGSHVDRLSRFDKMICGFYRVRGDGT